MSFTHRDNRGQRGTLLSALDGALSVLGVQMGMGRVHVSTCLDDGFVGAGGWSGGRDNGWESLGPSLWGEECQVIARGARDAPLPVRTL